ncbi:hypothetical protein [Gordonia sp. (in: high G+C Gram-positive bacteria)]|uniref:hypothetical protein n=1 Tax=Gordonia sp. (in: high G+C Gram-positive bacteria) TaxID=84139 RepID=UPI00333FEB47
MNDDDPQPPRGLDDVFLRAQPAADDWNSANDDIEGARRWQRVIARLNSRHYI